MPRDRDDYEDDDRPRRPARRADDDYEDDDDRPRRRPAPPTNMAATASVVLGVLGVCTGPLTGLPAIICGIFGLANAKTSRTGGGMAAVGLTLGTLATLAGIAAGVYVVLAAKRGVEQFSKTIEESIAEAQAMETDNDNAGAVARAVGNHEQAQQRFPNPYPRPVPVPKGQEPPVPLSWRVNLLPYLGQDQLHRRFALDKLATDPQNAALTSTRVEQYASDKTTPDTRWRGFVGAGSVFEPGAVVAVAGITDGTSNTCLFVDGGTAKPWVPADDIPFTNTLPGRAFPPKKGEAAKVIPPLGKPGAGGGFLMAMCDGSVRYVRKDVPPDTLLKLIDRADGNVIPDDWEPPGGNPFDD